MGGRVGPVMMRNAVYDKIFYDSAARMHYRAAHQPARSTHSRMRARTRQISDSLRNKYSYKINNDNTS